MARAKAAVGDAKVDLAWVEPPREPSRISSTSSQGWKWIAAAARADAPDAVLTPILVVAGTDSRNMESVSQAVYRFMPMHFTLTEAGMIHGTNEHMADRKSTSLTSSPHCAYRMTSAASKKT